MVKRLAQLVRGDLARRVGRLRVEGMLFVDGNVLGRPVHLAGGGADDSPLPDVAGGREDVECPHEDHLGDFPGMLEGKRNPDEGRQVEDVLLVFHGLDYLIELGQIAGGVFDPVRERGEKSRKTARGVADERRHFRPEV